VFSYGAGNFVTLMHVFPEGAGNFVLVIHAFPEGACHFPQEFMYISEEQVI
jgi:hypothetical protein